VAQKPTDVFLLSWAGVGGYGDPLEREPARVVLDIGRGNITCEWAYEAYGVIVNEQLHVEAEATEARRAQVRKARLRKGPKRTRQKVDPTQARRMAEGLLLVDGIIACNKCAHEICPATENYKLYCAMIEQPITAANSYILNPKTYVDDKMVFRSYACPNCGLLLQMEMTRPTDPPLWDIQLA
jgi:N-methylhydantoinase B